MLFLSKIAGRANSNRSIKVVLIQQVYHLVEGRSHEVLFNDDELEEHQPFPTLQEVMETIDPHVGFNVELKWTMEMNDGTFELNNPFDINTYVDKVSITNSKAKIIKQLILSGSKPAIYIICCIDPLILMYLILVIAFSMPKPLRFYTVYE